MPITSNPVIGHCWHLVLPAWSPWAFFSPGWTIPAVSLSSNDRCPQSSVRPVPESSPVKSMFLLYWGAQHWTQHLRCVPPVSLDLLAVVCLVQSRRLLASFAARVNCQLMVDLVSTRTAQVFSAEFLSIQSALALADAWRYSSPGAGLCISLC